MENSEIIKIANEGLGFRKPGNIVVCVPVEKFNEDPWKYYKEKPIFHLFAKLPPEIRVAIWKYAVCVQKRVVKTYSPQGCMESTLGIIHAPVPPLFLVNKEAFYEARKYYVRFPSFITASSKPSPTGPLICFDDDVFFHKKRREYEKIFGITCMLVQNKKYCRIPFVSHPLYWRDLPEAVFNELEPPWYQDEIVLVLSNNFGWMYKSFSGGYNGYSSGEE